MRGGSGGEQLKCAGRGPVPNCRGHRTVTALSLPRATVRRMNVMHRLAAPIRPLALGGALLRGVFEFVALWRARLGRRSRP